MNVKPGIYRHFKGGVYTVVGVSRHTETGEDCVVYRDSQGRFFHRDVSDFLSSVPGRHSKARFVLLVPVNTGHVPAVDLLRKRCRTYGGQLTDTWSETQCAEWLQEYLYDSISKEPSGAKEDEDQSKT